MLMELTIIPLARGHSLSADLAEAIGLIDASKLPYKVTDFGTLIEGSWEELMSIARKCHIATGKKTDRVLMLIRLDDYGDRTDLLSTHRACRAAPRASGQEVVPNPP